MEKSSGAGEVSVPKIQNESYLPDESLVEKHGKYCLPELPL